MKSLFRLLLPKRFQRTKPDNRMLRNYLMFYNDPTRRNHGPAQLGRS